MSTDQKAPERRCLPAEEERALANLIGPIPCLKRLPDPNDDETVVAIKRVLRTLRDRALDTQHEPIAEVMNRCIDEIDRESLPPVIDNIRYQIGVALIGMELKESLVPAEASEPSSQP